MKNSTAPLLCPPEYSAFGFFGDVNEVIEKVMKAKVKKARIKEA